MPTPSIIVSLRAALTACLIAPIVCGSLARAQTAPAGTPFEQGVQMSVVASKPARSSGGYYSDKVQKIVLTVKFTNRDLRQAYDGYKATISGFGESAVDSKIKMVLMQETAALSLQPGKTFEHVCAEVVTEFYKSYSGYSYDGWIIVVRDPKGKIVQVKSSSATLEKYTELAGRLELNQCYTPKLQPCTGPRAISSGRIVRPIR